MVLQDILSTLQNDISIESTCSVEGICGPMCLYVGSKLLDAGITDLTIRHYYGYVYDGMEWGHYVIERNGIIIDPSWRQFDISAPIIKTGTLQEYQNKFPHLLKTLPFSDHNELYAHAEVVLEYVREIKRTL